MKKLLILLAIVFVGCDLQEYQTTPDGKQFYLTTYCVKSHTEKETGYHFGYVFLAAEFKWHWPIQCMETCTKSVCDQFKTDTIWRK